MLQFPVDHVLTGLSRADMGSFTSFRRMELSCQAKLTRDPGTPLRQASALGAPCMLVQAALRRGDPIS